MPVSKLEPCLPWICKGRRRFDGWHLKEMSGPGGTILNATQFSWCIVLEFLSSKWNCSGHLHEKRAFVWRTSSAPVTTYPSPHCHHLSAKTEWQLASENSGRSRGALGEQRLPCHVNRRRKKTEERLREWFWGTNTWSPWGQHMSLIFIRASEFSLQQ